MAIGKEVASYLEAHLLSIFLVFHLLRGQMGLSYFFSGVGRVKKDHKTEPGLLWDNGL